jgi:hypothetical protein
VGKGWSVAVEIGASAGFVVHGDARQGTTTYIPAVPHAFFSTGVGVAYAP